MRRRSSQACVLVPQYCDAFGDFGKILPGKHRLFPVTLRQNGADIAKRTRITAAKGADALHQVRRRYGRVSRALEGNQQAHPKKKMMAAKEEPGGRREPAGLDGIATRRFVEYTLTTDEPEMHANISAPRDMMPRLYQVGRRAREGGGETERDRAPPI